MGMQLELLCWCWVRCDGRSVTAHIQLLHVRNGRQAARCSPADACGRFKATRHTTSSAMPERTLMSGQHAGRLALHLHGQNNMVTNTHFMSCVPFGSSSTDPGATCPCGCRRSLPCQWQCTDVPKRCVSTFGCSQQPETYLSHWRVRVLPVGQQAGRNGLRRAMQPLLQAPAQLLLHPRVCVSTGLLFTKGCLL
jgi:hypothetical protein